LAIAGSSEYLLDIDMGISCESGERIDHHSNYQFFKDIHFFLRGKINKDHDLHKNAVNDII